MCAPARLARRGRRRLFDTLSAMSANAQPHSAPRRHGRPGHDLRRDLPAVLSRSCTPRASTAATSASSTSRWPPSPAARAPAPSATRRAAGDRIADFASFDGSGQRRRMRSRRASISSASPRRTTATSTPRKQALAGRQARADRKAVGARACRSSTSSIALAAAARACWPRSSITSCSTPTTRSCARSSPTACCSTSTTATARCWSRSQISGSQFAEWITGRNPGTYVAVHYIKLIDFTFGGRLKTVACTGQRGLVGPADGPTWDSTQLRLVYEYADGREAAFDIHTSWVTPDNFPGYVEQEVQFRFDNGVWNGHQRKRGVECTVEGTHADESRSRSNTPLQRRRSSSRGASARSAATASRCSSGSSRRSPTSSSAARPSAGAIALDEMRALALQRSRRRPPGRRGRAGDGGDPGPARRGRAGRRRAHCP